MNHVDVADLRLQNQRITRPLQRGVGHLVAWFGAVQAQEYGPAKWGLALRLQRETTDAALERAIDQGRILRTHILRPTWHFVSSADIRWMLDLTAPEVHRRMSNYDSQLGLDARVMTRATGIIERALGDGRCLTRQELGAQLAHAGLPRTATHLAHMAMYAELEGVICSGPRRGKRSTYALLADRAPGAKRLSREEALAELALRFFRSHGPATVRDFVWWSGLRTADAKRGLEMNRAKSLEVDGINYWTIRSSLGRSAKPRSTVHLLPIYDEYLVAYRDRHAVPHIQDSSWASNLRHALVIGGQVTGTWRTILAATRVTLVAEPVRRLSAVERRALTRAAAGYGRFLGVPLTLSVA
jgi:Winged helix DNA-binding domain